MRQQIKETVTNKFLEEKRSDQIFQQTEIIHR